MMPNDLPLGQVAHRPPQHWLREARFHTNLMGTMVVRIVVAMLIGTAHVESADLIRITHYGFDGNLTESTRTQAPFEPLWNAGISNGVLSLGLVYQSEARMPVLNGFWCRSFTVAVDFVSVSSNLSETSFSVANRAIAGSRWKLGAMS